MSELSTLDRPAETADTKTETPDETKDESLNEAVTEDQESAQTDQTDEPKETPDHLAELEATRLEAERAAIREEERQALADSKAQEERESREKARKERVKQAFPSSLTKLSSVLDSVERELATDGQTYELNRKLFTDVLEGLNLEVEASANERISEQYHEAFAANLGQDAEAFWQEAEALKDEHGMLPVASLLELYADKRALQAKPIKSMTLDQAKSASPQVARELANVLKAEYLKGRDDPSPAGEPRGTGRDGGARQDLSTRAKARALHVAGRISNETMRRINADPSIPEGL